jgi:outer membrane lipoprotein-sorting protein
MEGTWMTRNNRLLAAGILLGAVTFVIAADPPPLINPVGAPGVVALPDELPANATVDQILDALDQRGKSLHEFTAKVSLTSGDPSIGDQSTRIGKLSYQKKPDDSALLRVQFEKRLVGKIYRDEKSEYLLDDRWLTDRDYRSKTETLREVARPGQKINLLKLGEGHFPLPIGQDKADVHKQFDVKIIPAAKDDPPVTIHIELKPLPDSQFSQKFGAIQVWVDRKSNFPVRIDTADKEGADEHTTRLEDVVVNPPGGLKPEEFKLPAIDPQEWSHSTQPYRD